MSELEQQAHEVQISVEEAEENIKLHEALKRLNNNPDFDLVIQKGFFEAEASRSVIMKSTPNAYSNPKLMEMLDGVIAAIGGLYQYFHKIEIQGDTAEQALREHQETLDEIQEEVLENESRLEH